MDIVIWIILLVALVLTAFAAVAVRTLMMSTVLLALTSLFVAISLFLAGVKLAAVIELSVSVGLVTAILASAIALLNPTGDMSETRLQKGGRIARYLPLAIIMLLLAAGILVFVPPVELAAFADIAPSTSAQLLWGLRSLDVIGIALLILAGVLGVAALIKRREEH
ncbi:MAG: hypothetical protein FWE65_01350 [Eggerthellaceae bacterium]|nr:hypothetical protein [Eggerthellaceae bacterium]